MKRLLRAALACVALLSVAASTAGADEIDVAKAMIAPLEREMGTPVAMLDRSDNDPAEFWYKAMQTLCSKTGDSWCDDELQILQDTTNQIGWARVLVYRGDDGREKKVCVVLPPRRGITSGFVATGLTAGSVFGSDELPRPSSIEAWLILMHAASCGSSMGDQRDMARADAFATLSLTLMQGDPAFVSGFGVSDARRIAGFRNVSSNRWAVNVGERILLDLWKDQAARVLTGRGCSVTTTQSADLNTDYLRRDSGLPAGADCTNTQTTMARGVVTDANLWLWTLGGYRSDNPVVGSPPAPYQAFQTFDGIDAATSYVWRTADRLSVQ